MATLKAIAILYISLMIGALIAIPFGYVAAPIFAILHALPWASREYGGHLAWLCLTALVAAIFVNDWLERLEAAGLSQLTERPWLRRLPGLAHVWRARPVAEDAAALPDASLRLTSRRLSERD